MHNLWREGSKWFKSYGRLYTTMTMIFDQQQDDVISGDIEGQAGDGKVQVNNKNSKWTRRRKQRMTPNYSSSESVSSRLIHSISSFSLAVMRGEFTGRLLYQFKAMSSSMNSRESKRKCMILGIIR